MTQEELMRLQKLFATRIEDRVQVPMEKRGWQVIVTRSDGTVEEITDFGRLTLVNPRIGAVNLGKSPQGDYDQWAFHEVNGGRSVIVPWALIDGVLRIGLLEERRPFQNSDGVAWNVPRGFADPGQTHFQAAVAETSEEIGITVDTSRLTALGGDPVNPNSTFFETWGELPNGGAEGIRFYAYEFRWSELAKDGVDWRITTQVKPKPGIGEKIYRCRFTPASHAATCGDIFTLAGLARLVFHLAIRGSVEIGPEVRSEIGISALKYVSPTP